MLYYCYEISNSICGDFEPAIWSTSVICGDLDDSGTCICYMMNYLYILELCAEIWSIYRGGSVQFLNFRNKI
jgi:hypothetical protein